MCLTHFSGNLYSLLVCGKRWRLDRLFSRGFRLCCCLLAPISLRHSCTSGIFNQTVSSVAEISQFNVRRPATTFREFPPDLSSSSFGQATYSIEGASHGHLTPPAATTSNLTDLIKDSLSPAIF